MNDVVDDYQDLPNAHSLTWFKCANCQNLHIVLKDDRDDAFSIAAVSEEMLVKMLEVVRGAEVQ